MSQSIISSDVIQKAFEDGINLAASGVASAFWQAWLINQEFIIKFIILPVLVIIIAQIILLKVSKGRSKLPAEFNVIAGTVLYIIFFFLYFAIAYNIFGSQVVDDNWFDLFGILSYPTTWVFFRAIGFWYY